jgi:hypothetical protein
MIEGFLPYIYEAPPDGVLIELWRPEWSKRHVCYRHELDPLTNVQGLYWRITGIGREQLAAQNRFKSGLPGRCINPANQFMVDMINAQHSICKGIEEVRGLFGQRGSWLVGPVDGGYQC